MKKLYLLLLISCNLLVAETINVAVATNVSYAIEELKKAFEKENKSVKVRVILGSSGKLTAQIKHGAPYGVFISADTSYPEYLFKHNLAKEKPLIYAKGSLALFSKDKRDFSKKLELLKSNEIKRIALANPKTAPYGKAALEALKNKNIYTDLNKKFIYGESISQTLSYTLTAADMGIVAKSLLHSKKMARFKENENWIALDTKLYTPIEQAIALLNDSKPHRDFYNFILGKKSKNNF